ncbi:MAG: dynamin family protein [Bacteroidota bacterium]
MQEKEVLKNDLAYTSERLKNIANELPEKLATIKSTDSTGRDEQNLAEIIKSISKKFNQFSEELETPFKIAVVGSQGTGKSTIVNLLLGEPLMPSTTFENESAVIRLAYPPDKKFKDQAIFELLDGTRKQTSIIEANTIIDKAKRDEVNEAFVKQIKYVTFYKDNEQLKKIELVNTPGMNVLTDDFYPKVKHLFTEADVILWVNAKEQILDNFNSWLIKKIHADNDKIVGFITFPDKLYNMDVNEGVTSVVTQFMEVLEDGKLIREQNSLALFILNGKFAQISESHKTNLKFINNTSTIDIADKRKLRMLYNFLRYGFAYSDDANNSKILKQYNLYGLEENISQIDFEFNLDHFYNYCIDHNYCKIDDDGIAASYTKKGRMLLGEASQYNSFGRFTEDYLLPMSLKSKVGLVESRIERMLSVSESSDNSISRLLQIKEKLENEKDSLDHNEQIRIEEFDKLTKTLKSDFKVWVEDNIECHCDNYSDELTDSIISRIEKEINGWDFVKEIGNSITRSFLKSSKETAVTKKISIIISETIEIALPKHIDNIVNEANTEIERILNKMQQDYLSNKNKFNTNSNAPELNVSPNLNTNKILNTIWKKLQPKLNGLLKNVMVTIAKKDLRRGSNTFLKKNIIKPVVILIRKLLTKIGVKFAKKKAATAVTKTGMGPVGWVLLIVDVLWTANDLHDMYKEMKKTLGNQLKDEPLFREGFKNEAESVLNEIIDVVIADLDKSSSEESIDSSFIIEGINNCDNVLNELDKYATNHIL